METIEESFNTSFAHWGIRLPADAVKQRKSGRIVQAGWAIWYLCGHDDQGEYLDYYASHRMTNDQHLRLRASGISESLPAMQDFHLCSDDPEEDARLEAEYFARNQEVGRMLEAKGFRLLGRQVAPKSSRIADYKIYFSAEDRERFRSGELARGWAERFPQLFGETDLRLALNQTKYHFYEWLTAVRLFSDHGYLSLIEKYHFKRHPGAYARFQQLAPPEIVDLLSGGGPGPRTQGPDLLTFSPNFDVWFFVEVKGPRDRVRDSQAELFHRLEQLSGQPVRIAQCWQQE
jgi:hypothetical protein